MGMLSVWFAHVCLVLLIAARHFRVVNRVARVGGVYSVLVVVSGYYGIAPVDCRCRPCLLIRCGALAQWNRARMVCVFVCVCVCVCVCMRARARARACV